MSNSVTWQQFGLKKNPYDTLPLVEGGDLPIEKAFVGRDDERVLLNRILNDEGRLCFAVCGDVGVGKTSFINFQKIIWKYQQEKLLFSPRREIEASAKLLDKKSFLLEVIGSVLLEIQLLAPDMLKKEPLKQLRRIVDVSQTLDLSLGASIPPGWGAGIGIGKQVAQPLEIPVTVIEGYFRTLVDFLSAGNEIHGFRYSGLIVHVNNFDVVMSDEELRGHLARFFNELRDILQTPNTFFLFLGPTNFYRDIISPQKRVKSIFYQTPLQLKPLTKREVVDAFDKRMELLKSDGVQLYTKPVDDQVIYRLYDIFEGDIRSIMAAVTDIVGQHDLRGTSLPVDEAMVILGRLRWEELTRMLKLTKAQISLLNVIVDSKAYVSQKYLAGLQRMPTSNLSGYYFKAFKEAGIIEEKERRGREVFYGLTSQYLPLQHYLASRKHLQKRAAEEQQLQLGL